MWKREEELAAESDDPPELTLDRCLAKAAKIVRHWGKEKAKLKKLQETQLRSTYSTAQQNMPQDPILQANLSTAAQALHDLENTRAAWMDSVIQARWMADGDRCTRLFFKSFQHMSKATEISAVFNEDGDLFTKWEDMAAIAIRHFEKLLETSQGTFPEELQYIIDAPNTANLSIRKGYHGSTVVHPRTSC